MTAQAPLRNADAHKKTLLMQTLSRRGKLACERFSGRFATGIYFLDLTLKNAVGSVTRYYATSGTDLIKALEALEVATRAWPELRKADRDER